jgi:hypothetical protein
MLLKFAELRAKSAERKDKKVPTDRLSKTA